MLNRRVEREGRAYPRRSDGLGSERGWSLPTIVSILRWHRKLISATTLLMLAAAVLYVLIAPPSYTATASVVLDTKRSAPNPLETTPENLVDMAVVESQLEVLRSDRVALAAVDALQLWNDPAFKAQPSIVQLARQAIGLVGTPTPDGQDDKRQIALGVFKEDLKIERAGRSYVIHLSYTSRDANKAAIAVNALIEAYIATQLAGTLENARRASAWMEQRVGELRQQAVAAAGAVEDYKSSNNLVIDATGRLVSETELTELAASLAQARAETAQAHAKVERVAAVLKQHGGLTDSYQVEMEIARSREEALQKRMTEVFQQAAWARQGLVQLRDLEAKAQAYKAIHDAFLNQYTRTIQQQSLPVTEARALTLAAPPLIKSSPKTALVIFLSLIGGAGMGIMGALSREFFRDPVRTPRQMEDELGVPTLASLPRLSSARLPRRRKGLKLVNTKLSARGVASRRLPAIATEAMRSIRLAIDEHVGRGGGCVIAVISARDDEGKSTIAGSLAALTAATGSRTLLIDADLRRARHAKGVPADGLLAVLNGTARLSDALARDEDGFDRLIPEPNMEGDPTVLLGSAAMAQLLDTARQNYAYVVIDTASMLPQADVRALAHNVNSFVLVAEWGRTSVADVQRALISCDDAARRLTGVVLNKTSA